MLYGGIVLRQVTLYFLLFVSFFISGCAASGPQFSHIEDPPEDLSKIYIYRPYAFTASGVGFPIIHNEEQLPYILHNKGYLSYLAQPGHHKMNVNVDGLIDRVFEFDTVSGETCFLKVTIQDYFMVFGTKLSLVDKAIALNDLKDCKLSTTGNSMKAEIQDIVPTMGEIAKATHSTVDKNPSESFVADEIRKLNDLKQEGIITEEEFKFKKDQLLNL